MTLSEFQDDFGMKKLHAKKLMKWLMKTISDNSTVPQEEVEPTIHVSRRGSVTISSGGSATITETSPMQDVTEATLSEEASESPLSTGPVSDIVDEIPSDVDVEEVTNPVASADVGYWSADAGYNTLNCGNLKTLIEERDIVFEGGIHRAKKAVLIEILTAHDDDAAQFQVNNAFLPFGWWNNPYKSMKVGALKTLIRTTRNLKIKGISGMKKVALVNILIRHDNNPDEFPLNVAKSVSKTSKVPLTPDTQCMTRKWNKALTGNHQCTKARLSGTEYCKACNEAAMNWDGAVGPELWKFCAENNLTRKDTKTKKGLWFGRVDQFEPSTTLDKCAPVTSFVGDDGKRVVVTCYPNSEYHAQVSNEQFESGAALGHDLLKETWSKSWHIIGQRAQTERRAAKKASKKKQVVVDDPFEDDPEESDDEQAEESIESEEAATTPVECEKGVVATVDDDEGDVFVEIVDGESTFYVNTGTLEIRHIDDAFRGQWNVRTTEERPETITKEWLKDNGFPDEDACEYADGLVDDSDDEDDE